MRRPAPASLAFLGLSSPWEQEPGVQYSFYTPIVWAINSEPKGKPHRIAVNSTRFEFSTYHCRAGGLVQALYPAYTHTPLSKQREQQQWVLGTSELKVTC